MKGGLSSSHRYDERPESPPHQSISVYNSILLSKSSNMMIETPSFYPSPIADLADMDVASLFSPQFAEVNEKTIKSEAYQPISTKTGKIPRDSVYSRIKRKLASFYFKHTILVKFVVFVIYYAVGVAYYTTKQPWTILDR